MDFDHELAAPPKVFFDLALDVRFFKFRRSRLSISNGSIPEALVILFKLFCREPGHCISHLNIRRAGCLKLDFGNLFHERAYYGSKRSVYFELGKTRLSELSRP